MFCRKCGNEIPSDSVFCAKCGVKVSSDVSGGRSNLRAIAENAAKAMCLPQRTSCAIELCIQLVAVALLFIEGMFWLNLISDGELYTQIGPLSFFNQATNIDLNPYWLIGVGCVTMLGVAFNIFLLFFAVVKKTLFFHRRFYGVVPLGNLLLMILFMLLGLLPRQDYLFAKTSSPTVLYFIELLVSAIVAFFGYITCMGYIVKKR